MGARLADTFVGKLKTLVIIDQMIMKSNCYSTEKLHETG